MYRAGAQCAPARFKTPVGWRRDVLFPVLLHVHPWGRRPEGRLAHRTDIHPLRGAHVGLDRASVDLWCGLGAAARVNRRDALRLNPRSALRLALKGLNAGLRTILVEVRLSLAPAGSHIARCGFGSDIAR